MTISIIAAMDQKRGIGKNNKLPWHIPVDLKRFRKLTLGHPVIMGRKTYESIGRPLPNRLSIIVSRNIEYRVSNIENVIIAASLEEAIKVAKQKDQTEVFVIGGGQIFAQALPMVDKLYLTLVKGDFGADTFFPDYSSFTKKTFEEKGQFGGNRFTFVNLEK